jgi:formamidase
MGLTEIRNICEVSLDIPAEKQPKLHNRWHPDIPSAGSIKNGETVKIECVSTPSISTVSLADFRLG